MKSPGSVFRVLALAFLVLAPAATEAKEPTLDGSSLSDISAQEPGGLGAVSGAVLKYWLGQKDLHVQKNISISLQSLEDGSITIDILGQDPRFKMSSRRLGVLRAKLAVSARDNAVEVTGHRIVAQFDFGEMSPTLTVSLADRLVLLADAQTGFRRTWPLEVSSFDNVRFHGIATLMTPTTELAVLNKSTAMARRTKPYYYRGEPFIPLMVPVEYGSSRYRQSDIGFHIYQNRHFIRAFDSHGCMRLRKQDLHELLAVVQAARATVPVRVRMHDLKEYRHPEPYFTKYWQRVKNVGTAENPRAKKDYLNEEKRKMAAEIREYGHVVGSYSKLTVTEKVQGSPPATDALVGVSMDPPNGDGPSPAALVEGQ